MPQGRTLGVKESAAYLGLSEKTVRRHVKRGTLPHKVVVGKFGAELRIFQSGLDRILVEKQKKDRSRENVREVLRLYGEASPEVRELVLKILRSEKQEETPGQPGGLLASLFRWKKEAER